MLKVAIIIFAIHAVSIYSMQIDCVYVNIDWIEVGKYYMNEISFSDIVGDHSAFNKSYFSNLQQLKWMSASLMNITAKDLRQFPNLQILYLNESLLSTLCRWQFI